MSVAHSIFSSKAEKYARYRWDYAQQAIQTILDKTQPTGDTLLLDVGAGTGILTRHFTGIAGRVLALEPNPEMRRLAARGMPAVPSAWVVGGCAEATPLPRQSVDIITIGTAISWFDPSPARLEFKRILKPGGWLSILWNSWLNQDLAVAAAVGSLSTEENGVTARIPLPFTKQPADFYFEAGWSNRLTFPFTSKLDWPAFIGSLTSSAFMPDETHPKYPNLEKAARRVFESLSSQGWLEMVCETELWIGQPFGVSN